MIQGNRIVLISLAGLLACQSLAYAQKGGKGGAWALFRDATGDAIQSDAVLWGFPKPYVTKQEGVGVIITLENKFSWPFCQLTAYQKDVRSVWVQAPACPEGDCLNPFPGSGGYARLQALQAYYPVAPSVGETLPTQVSATLRILETDDVEESLYFSWYVDSAVPPTVQGIDDNGDGEVDKLEVVVSSASVPDWAQLQRKTYLSKNKVEFEEIDLGWTSVPFACTFSIVPLP